MERVIVVEPDRAALNEAVILTVRRATEQANLVSNLAGDLGAVKDEDVQYTMASYFHKADAGYGRALAAALRLDGARVVTLAGKLRN